MCKNVQISTPEYECGSNYVLYTCIFSAFCYVYVRRCCPLHRTCGSHSATFYITLPLLPFGSRWTLLRRFVSLSSILIKISNFEIESTSETFFSSNLTNPFRLRYSFYFACESPPIVPYTRFYLSDLPYVGLHPPLYNLD